MSPAVMMFRLYENNIKGRSTSYTMIKVKFRPMSKNSLLVEIVTPLIVFNKELLYQKSAIQARIAVIAMKNSRIESTSSKYPLMTSIWVIKEKMFQKE